MYDAYSARLDCIAEMGAIYLIPKEAWMSIASACFSRYLSHTAKVRVSQAESDLTQTTRPLEPFKGNISSLCIHTVFVHFDLIDDTVPSLHVHRFTREASCLYYSPPHQIS
jgi:hypothetical protein